MFACLRSITWMLAAACIFTLAGCSKGGPDGTYEAKAPAGEQGSLTLEFHSGSDKVKLVMVSPMGKMEFTCDFKMDGDKVKVQPPQGSPMGDVLTLTPKGDGYEANDAGQTLTFVKK